MKNRIVFIAIALVMHQSVIAQFKLETVFAGGNHISFINSVEGFSFGSTADNIYHTTDAGYTWRLMATDVQSKTGGLYNLENMAFLDSNTIFAISADLLSTYKTYIYKTSDGGTTWHIVYTSPVDTSGWNSQMLYNIKFTDATHGWASGNHTVIATTDGGSTWHQQLSLPSAYAWFLEGMFFLNNSNGYICGQGGTALHTTDGGSHWTIQHIDTASTPSGAIASLTCYYLDDVYFRDVNHGYISADNGGYMTTNNGGATWTMANTGSPYDNKSVHFSDTSTVWMSGGPYCDNTGCYTNSTILYNRDNTGWQTLVATPDVYIGGSLGFGNIHFLNPALGYASNDDGNVYRITDTTKLPLSVKNISAGITRVYPDPATDYINLELSTPVSGTFEIYNTIGQKMITTEQKNTNIATMNIAALPKGNYFIVLHSQQQTITAPFSKI